MTKLANALLYLVVFSFAPHASATTILDTTNGVSFVPCCSDGDFIQNNSSAVINLALAFTSPSDATITDIKADISGPGNIFFGIMGDDSGHPSGTFLFQTTVIVSATEPIELAFPGWTISGGKQYWLTAIIQSIPAVDTWNISSGTNPAGFQLDGGSWTVFDEQDPIAIITADLTDTPLPSALPLFATGLGGLGLLSWRRKRKAQASA
jgi:hypothetical protein